MKNIGSYILKLQERLALLEKEQLGDDIYNQVMVKKELKVLECIVADLGELDSSKKYRCFSYWTC